MFFIRRDFNGHIGLGKISMGTLGHPRGVMIMCMKALVMGRGMKEEPHFLIFSRGFGSMLENTSFPKKKNTWLPFIVRRTRLK